VGVAQLVLRYPAVSDCVLLQLVNKAAAKFDQMQLTSFLDAAANGDVDVVQDMLRQGMNPNTSDYDGRTALMIAAYKGRKVGCFAFMLICGQGLGFWVFR
jgi:ankyrin repeat protein